MPVVKCAKQLVRLNRIIPLTGKAIDFRSLEATKACYIHFNRLAVPLKAQPERPPTST